MSAMLVLALSLTLVLSNAQDSVVHSTMVKQGGACGDFFAVNPCGASEPSYLSLLPDFFSSVYPGDLFILTNTAGDTLASGQTSQSDSQPNSSTLSSFTGGCAQGVSKDGVVLAPWYQLPCKCSSVTGYNVTTSTVVCDVTVPSCGQDTAHVTCSGTYTWELA